MATARGCVRGLGLVLEEDAPGRGSAETKTNTLNAELLGVQPTNGYNFHYVYDMDDEYTDEALAGGRDWRGFIGYGCVSRVRLNPSLARPRQGL